MPRCGYSALHGVNSNQKKNVNSLNFIILQLPILFSTVKLKSGHNLALFKIEICECWPKARHPSSFQFTMRF